MDQLHQVILEHHLAGGDGDVLAHLELAVIGHPDAQLALAPLQVGEQVGQALEQIGAAGLGGAAQHLGVGHDEIRRAHRIDELAGIEIHFLGRLGVQPLSALHHGGEIPAAQQITLPNEIKHLIFAPGIILEAAVAARLLDHRGRIAAHHPPRGVGPQGQVILPEADLRLHQLRRIGHHLRRHLHEGMADIQRVGLGRILGLAAQEVTHDALASLRHIGHGTRHQRRVRQAEMGGLVVVFIGHDTSVRCCTPTLFQPATHPGKPGGGVSKAHGGDAVAG